VTDTTSEFETSVRRLTRYWPAVLAAVIVGAGLGVVFAKYSAPSAPYQATSTVRIVSLQANTRGTSPDGVRAAAITPQARAAVVASLGPEASAGIGAISAQVDPKDATLAHIVVAGTERQKTAAFADALAHVAVQLNANDVDGPARTYLAVASRAASAAAALNGQIVTLQVLVQKKPDDPTAQSALLAAQSAQGAALDEARLYRLNADLWNGTISYLPATVGRASHRGAYITAALQGAIIGFAVGLLIAWIADRLRRRPASAA